MISTLDIAWAAGFFEGEGSFHSPRATKPRLDGTRGRVAVMSISQVQLEPLERFRRFFGGYIYFRKRKHNKDGRWKDFYVWSLRRTKAAALTMTFWVFLSERRRAQAKILLDAWRDSGPHMGVLNRLKTHCLNGHPFTAENTALGKKGHRHCKACAKQRKRAYAARDLAGDVS